VPYYGAQSVRKRTSPIILATHTVSFVSIACLLQVISRIDAPMPSFFDQLIVRLWNRLRGRRRGAWQGGGTLDLGFQVLDEGITRRRISLSNTRRTMHVALLGKTGSGKSFL